MTAARGCSLAPVADWERGRDGTLCAGNAGTTLVGHLPMSIGLMLALPIHGAKQKADPSRRGGLGMTKRP